MLNLVVLIVVSELGTVRPEALPTTPGQFMIIYVRRPMGCENVQVMKFPGTTLHHTGIHIQIRVFCVS